MQFKQVDVDSLKAYPQNARTHNEKQVAQIAESIKEFGFLAPCLVDKDNVLIVGHGRLMAAKTLGMKKVPTLRIEHLTPNQVKAYRIADNQLALNAGWDMDLLGLDLTELSDAEFDIDLLGFDAKDLDALIGNKEGLTDPDEVPEEPETPVTKAGDLWLLGNHRLLCGDSTSIDAVERLLDGVKPDLVYTDPPYGINEKGDRTARKTGLAPNHNFRDFKDDTIQYAVDAYNLCEGIGIKRQVWWGANYYCHALPQTNNWFVWDKRVEDKLHDTQSDCELAWVKSKWSSVRIFRHLWKGFNKDSERGQARVHPTQKPVALAEWAFNYYKDVKTVMDLFLGSGTTLIACEKTGRTSYAAELMPEYCDVSVTRWQNFTGKDAKLETGETFKEKRDAQAH